MSLHYTSGVVHVVFKQDFWTRNICALLNHFQDASIRGSPGAPGSGLTCKCCMQVSQQVKVIEEQLARADVDEWERDILMSELDLLNNIRNNHTPHT